MSVFAVKSASVTIASFSPLHAGSTAKTLAFGVLLIKKMEQPVNNGLEGLDLGWKELMQLSQSSHSSTTDIDELLLAASQRFELEAGSVHASDYENVDQAMDDFLLAASRPRFQWTRQR